MKMVKAIVTGLIVIALIYAGNNPFSEYKEKESIIERLEINFFVSFYAGRDSKYYIIEKKDDRYIDDSGKIIDSILVENFIASLTDLYTSHGFEAETVMTDYYPSFHISVKHSRGEIIIASESNAHCNIPWNVEMNGQTFVQFNGKIPTALFALLIEIDEDYWSFMDKEARFNCFSSPIPLEYTQKGLSPFFPHSSPGILPEEERGHSHVEWTADIGDFMMEVPMIRDGNVYCATRDRIFCLDVLTGKMKWDMYYENEINGGWFITSDHIQYLDGKLYVRLRKGLICLDNHTGALLWEITGNQLRRSAVYQDGRLYIIIQLPKEEYSDDPDLLQLLCVNAQNGEIFWEYTFLKPGTGYLIEEVYMDDEQLYINSGEPALYCLDARTGDVIWDYSGCKISEIHAFKTNMMLINSTQGVVTCLDKKTGTVKWEKSNLSRIYDVKIMSDDTILIPTFTSSEISDILLHVDTGEILWEGQIFGYGQKDISDENILYFRTGTEKTLYALQITTGKELWKCDFENKIKNVYVTKGGILVAGIPPEEESWSFRILTLYFLDREGNIKWRYQYDPYRFCTGIDAYVHDSLLFITTNEGIIDAFDYNTGTVVWSTELRGREIFELLFHNKNIYCSCDDGRIYCISEETGDIRWIVNTESGFTLSSTFSSIYIEIYGELLLVSIEDGLMFVISME